MKFWTLIWKIALAMIIGAALTTMITSLLSYPDQTYAWSIFAFNSVLGLIIQPHLAKLLRFDLK